MTTPEQGPAIDTPHDPTEYFGPILKERVFGAYPFAEPLYRDLTRIHPVTASHSDRTALIASGSAGMLGLSEYDELRVATAGLLHDIGKTALPPEQLLNHPTPSDLAKIRYSHMEAARSILRDSGCPSDIMHIIMSHHDVFPVRALTLTGISYPRSGTRTYEDEDRRKNHDPSVVRMAKLVWFADKFDRYLNGYSGDRKQFLGLFTDIKNSFDQRLLSEEAALFTSVVSAVGHLFYPYGR